jgi:hypothetical protein
MEKEWIIAGVGFILVSAVFLNYWFEKKRTDAFKAFSQQNGFLYEPKLNPEILQLMGSFRLFQKGHSQEDSNVLSRDIGSGKIWIFDYRYTTGSGRSRSTVRQTVVGIQSPKLSLPDFFCRPGGKISSFFSNLLGDKDIPVEADPEFSDRFLVSGSDGNAVRNLFNRPQIGQLMRRERNLCVEGRGNLLIFFRSGIRTRPEALLSLSYLGEEIFSSFY